ncbi:MAG: tRNA (guanine-N(1)-)-methyltransferase [Microgenomates group bacterium GW2011_GWC1_41_20]|nr:MAG: tRNA (guanine-N(1)-)-methyltransferase [Candidatus Woesebacteria bacterium GW2011_GWB1_40_12]KKR55934.1 MAG: tRNA (guanine-N(1)-)-methyltransferase [Candidatus Woesebacteria bacterium GW2011_GWF1_40_24]KKR89500.1 MAG: tRNA (guanine-N(1)-)-methyltransferase [Candidatus Woesebacteria bacterium GW2011_GWD1_41_12]KKS00483.1 MAG: tRNA (guanine-N(1)-)-methyltransferase [Microgenomates group bacterium GW2011_GWC1_41_20]OGM84179.1 MAG: tRNA (guanosine(37)-N1)-methyltransferase TrmD [Candidatus 
MKIDVLTLFPNMFMEVFGTSIIKRAQSKGLLEVKVHDLRDWGEGERRNVDDRPYGGGVGMIMRVDIIDAAIQKLKSKNSKVIILDATGERYTQKKAQKLSKEEHLILVAGHYEGVDHRVHEHLADEVISIGDYVLTGGEIPSMVLVDSVIRLIPGVLGKDESSADESHKEPGYLEYPQYTRPEKYKNWDVPKILLSGDHGEIAKWRKNESSQ